MNDSATNIPGCANDEEALTWLRGVVRGTEHQGYFELHENRYRFVLGFVRAALPPGGGRVLEIGASPGHITALCAALGHEIAAVDLCPGAQFPPESGRAPLNIFEKFSLPVAAVDIASGGLPFLSGAFSLALFNETVEHIIGSPLPAMQEIARVLAPGGALIVTTPNVASLRNRLRLLFGLNVFTSLEAATNLSAYKCHNREYTLAELLQLVRMVGLEPESATRHNIGVPKTGAAGAARAAYYAVTWLWPPGRSLLCVRARKKK